MPLTKEKVHVLTLGCSKNTVDSEQILAQLKAENIEIVDAAEDATVSVINTCGFISDAKNESIQSILEAVELKKQGILKRVVVMGCLSERYAADLRREIPEVDLFVGANKMDQVVKSLGATWKHELLGERSLTTPQHYAYLKISEGCDNPCSFCAIPIMRGKHVSKPRERVVREAERLAALGVKEIILIAQDSTYYGLDLYGERQLADLLRCVSNVEGIEWIRLMYAYPSQFPLEVLDVMAENPKICRYLDMPIQHSSDRVLKSMRRGISARATADLLAVIRERVPDIVLRTTLIVGYPDEGDHEFQHLVDFVHASRFGRLGVFAYSQEEDTSAYALGDPVPQAVKEERRSIIMEIQREISRQRNDDLVGTEVRILVDERNDGVVYGRTAADAPEIDNDVIVENGHSLPVGDFSTVLVTDAGDYELFASPVVNVKVI